MRTLAPAKRRERTSTGNWNVLHALRSALLLHLRVFQSVTNRLIDSSVESTDSLETAAPEAPFTAIASQRTALALWVPEQEESLAQNNSNAVEAR